MTPKTQSVCEHCREEIIKTILGWITVKSRDILCFTEMSRNPRQGGHEPVSEPASTGEPECTCKKSDFQHAICPVHGAARPSEPSAPQCPECKTQLRDETAWYRCDTCHARYSSTMERGLYRLPDDRFAAPQTSAEPRKQCGCAHGDSDPYCPDPLCPNYIAAYHVKPPAPQPVSGDAPDWIISAGREIFVKRLTDSLAIQHVISKHWLTGDAPKVDIRQKCVNFLCLRSHPTVDELTGFIEALHPYFPPASQTAESIEDDELLFQYDEEHHDYLDGRPHQWQVLRDKVLRKLATPASTGEALTPNKWVGHCPNCGIICSGATSFDAESVANKHCAKPQNASQTDIANLRFYANMADENDWDTLQMASNVISQTLREIADRMATSASTARTDAKDKICAEIQNIMRIYREQDASSYGVDTPGGLEHMGDVWRLLGEWDHELSATIQTPIPPELCQESHPDDFLFCNLPKGHAGKHQDSLYEWTQEPPHTIERPAAPGSVPLAQERDLSFQVKEELDAKLHKALNPGVPQAEPPK